jgi:predicted pyridoxine 5'-phosphate oxidase superfamily flavin-nucleotide-binding protein
MPHRFLELTFTDGVKAEQQRYGSRERYEKTLASAAPHDALGPQEVAFITGRDSFYLASVGETGWPHLQHRGGPPGFLKVLSPRQLGFADFRGNLQYITVGNARKDDRVALFLMDYPERARLKLLGRLRVHEVADAPAGLARALVLPDYRARVERLVVIDVEAFDWNCSQHITPRFTEAEVSAAVKPLHERLGRLEAQLRALGAEPVP